MDRIIKPARLASLIILMVLLSAITMTSLYRLQVVEGASYAAQAKDSIVSTITIPAARGNILDRYGRVLVTNRTCNNLVINTGELFGDGSPEAIAAANATLLELVEAVTDAGDKYTDELPITKTAPFEYVQNMTDIQRDRLNSYLARNEDEGLSQSTTAVELMAFFRDRYNIDNNYTSEEMRTIAGIRYEINNRYVLGADYVFAEDVSIDLITRLMEYDVPGFDVVSSFVREYNTDAAAHILGYIGMLSPSEVEDFEKKGYSRNALVGKDGIELAFEDWLHGTDGVAQVISTKGGTVISTEYIEEVEPGGNVVTSIDIGMQAHAENALSSYIQQENAVRKENIDKYEGIPGYEDEVKDLITGGGIAAIEVKTGEPLCIASYPDYDVSTLMENYSEVVEMENQPLFNRALQGTYAPGSTFKPVTALASLNEGYTTVLRTIHDNVVFDKYEAEGYAPTCWTYPYSVHGDVNITEAIRISCNYYFYTVGNDLGIDKLSYYAMRFGLGVSTGIELNEETGVMSTQEYKEEVIGEQWRIGDTLQASIGQSFSLFTPFQLANYTATLANDGVRYEASMLKTVRSYDYSESLFQRTPTVIDEIMLDDPEYYRVVKLGMYYAANNSPGTTVHDVFSNFPVQVAAKTGTAQLGEGVTNNAVFICFAPYDDPEIAVAVVVEKGGSGSAVAEIAREVLSYYFSFKNSTVSIETESNLLR